MADMMSLILTFFVLLLSFANMDVVKFRMMLGSVQDAFGVQTPHPGEIEARATSPIELSDKESTAFLDLLDSQTRPPPSPPSMDQTMLRELEQTVAQQNLGRLVEIENAQRGVVVRVKGQLLFDSGSATLKAESLVFLDEIARLALDFPYPLAIEGHTDDVPIQTPAIPSNWHLSAARAIAALQYMAEAGGVPRDRLSAAGYADTRPLVPNDSPVNRATNRRVEFVYVRETPSGGAQASAR